MRTPGRGWCETSVVTVAAAQFIGGGTRRRQLINFIDTFVFFSYIFWSRRFSFISSALWCVVRYRERTATVIMDRHRLSHSTGLFFFRQYVRLFPSVGEFLFFPRWQMVSTANYAVRFFFVTVRLRSWKPVEEGEVVSFCFVFYYLKACKIFLSNNRAVGRSTSLTISGRRPDSLPSLAVFFFKVRVGAVTAAKVLYV